jgi:hypothetical protein
MLRYQKYGFAVLPVIVPLFWWKLAELIADTNGCLLSIKHGVLCDLLGINIGPLLMWLSIAGQFLILPGAFITLFAAAYLALDLMERSLLRKIKSRSWRT